MIHLLRGPRCLLLDRLEDPFRIDSINFSRSCLESLLVRVGEVFRLRFKSAFSTKASFRSIEVKRCVVPIESMSSSSKSLVPGEKLPLADRRRNGFRDSEKVKVEADGVLRTGVVTHLLLLLLLLLVVLDGLNSWFCS